MVYPIGFLQLGLDSITILTGIAIFFARVADVSMGTMRTISIVQGRTKVAFLVGLVEVSLWLVVIATVLKEISDKPVLGVFYAVGFSTGNVAGILLERRIGLGHVALRVISPAGGKVLAERIRNVGFGVTTFSGEGLSGPVTLLYIVCRRKDIKTILPVVRETEPDAFYITEQAGSVSRVYRPVMTPATGWRSVFKKK